MRSGAGNDWDDGGTRTIGLMNLGQHVENRRSRILQKQCRGIGWEIFVVDFFLDKIYDGFVEGFGWILFGNWTRIQRKTLEKRLIVNLKLFILVDLISNLLICNRPLPHSLFLTLSGPGFSEHPQAEGGAKLAPLRTPNW